MTWKNTTLVMMCMVVMGAGFAQPIEPTPDQETNADVAPPPPPPPPMAPPAVQEEGDVVILKTGRELRGVKVVSVNPLYVEVQYLRGEPPLQLPRGHVASVEYAQDRMSGRSTGVLGDLRHVPDIMPGEEVSRELHRMLTASMSEDDLVLEEADYLVVLRAFAANYGVDIDVNELLQAAPDETRRFSRVIPAGTTFLNFLRTYMADIAPDVRIILQYDRLVLQKREESEIAADDSPPPPPPPMPMD